MTDTIRIRLPWPSRHLSPNARLHWAQRHKAVKAARAEAFVLAKQALADHQWQPPRELSRPITFTVSLLPPANGRRRDFDNAIASLKPLLDGLADAMAVNDHLFRPVFRMANAEGRGAVIVDLPIEAAQEAQEREVGLGPSMSSPEWLKAS
jgi:Holliday junction resolvase RusA-like endonuclease